MYRHFRNALIPIRKQIVMDKFEGLEDFSVHLAQLEKLASEGNEAAKFVVSRISEELPKGENLGSRLLDLIDLNATDNKSAVDKELLRNAHWTYWQNKYKFQNPLAS